MINKCLKLSVLSALIMTSLAGCADTKNNPVQPQPKPGEFSDSATTPKIVFKKAFSGQTIEIVSMAMANLDCTSRNLGVLRIIRPPEHGKAEIVERDVYTHYPAGSPYAACNKVKMPGLVLLYTPDTDASTDQLSYEGIYDVGLSNGEIQANIIIQ